MAKTKCIVCNDFMGFDIGLGHHPNGQPHRKTKDGKWACSEKCARDYNLSLLNSGSNSGNSNSGNSDSYSKPSKIGSFISETLKSDEEKLAEQGLSGSEIAEIQRQKAAADLEKTKFDAEQAEIKRLRELEEKKVRVAKANDLRGQGKNNQAFFVEHKPSILIAAGVLIFGLIFGGIMLHDKFNEKNGAEISLKLEAIEDQVKLAIQSGDKEKALQLANQLVHPLHAEDKAQPFNTWSGYPKYDEEWNKKRQDYKDQIMAMANTTKPINSNIQQSAPPIQEQPTPPPPIQPQTDTTTSATAQPISSSTGQAHTGIIIADKTFFHKDPNPETIRKDFLVKGQPVTYAKSEGDFIYCTYNTETGTTTGWILKSDVQ